MKIFEHYWQSNNDWWYWDEFMNQKIKADAPKEAQDSYKRYLEQLESERGIS